MSHEVLVVGKGGREHALGWKLAESPHIHSIHMAPGNGGTYNEGWIHTSFDVIDPETGAYNFAALADYAERYVDFTVVGPDRPLAGGIVDFFRKRELPVFGPMKEAARLESSKIFAAEFMRSRGIPTPDFEVFTDRYKALSYVAIRPPKSFVIKADGLAEGKGVVLPSSTEEAVATISDFMSGQRFGAAGERILIQNREKGQELSVFALTDGERYILLPTSQDYKRLKDGDKGPNTGGMGAWGPVQTDSELTAIIDKSIIQPSIEGMEKAGLPFRGVLYVGLMLTDEGPKVIEYNARFGDPETQAQMLLLDEDIYPRLRQAAQGSLDTTPLRVKPGFAVTVALTAPGYPEKEPYTGSVITGLDKVKNIEVFHAGTELGKRGRILTAGGRVLHVAAYGETLLKARKKIYSSIGKHGIHFAKKHYRRDIAIFE